MRRCSVVGSILRLEPPLTDLAQLDAHAQAKLVAEGEATPRQLVEAAIERIEQLNEPLNAVIHTQFERALDQADGELPDGPFRGVPTLIKDLGAQEEGEPNHDGARFLKAADYRPDRDSYLVEQTKAAGFIIVGRTNTPEFGSQAITEPLAYGPSRNPWNTDHTPGGSSGGSGAAVASGMVPIAHASDGGGSIRIPSSCCGLFGHKPSRGRISRGPQSGEGWGGASTYGCVSRSVRDSAAYLDAVSGVYLGDPYNAPLPERPFLDEVGAPIEHLRIGVLDRPPLDPDGADPDCIAAVSAAAGVLEELGHDVTEAWPKALEDAEFTDRYLPLIAVAARQQVDWWSEELGRELGEGDVDPMNLFFAEMGRDVSGSQYLDCLNWLHSYSRRLAAFWTDQAQGGRGFDILLTPTIGLPPAEVGAMAAPTLDDVMGVLDITRRFIPFTAQFNVSGQPAMNVPLHWNADGLPIGTQLVGAPLADATLFRLAAQIEEARPWFNNTPPVFAG